MRKGMLWQPEMTRKYVCACCWSCDVQSQVLGPHVLRRMRVASLLIQFHTMGTLVVPAGSASSSPIISNDM
ncbi:hypothetical protein BR93DRAFT_775414 [Coniochaeta sp. PMI_546]|nr:hypothetical protein BR93DRAFT_775414 [Coniochaeta sp. PMI_546]